MIKLNKIAAIGLFTTGVLALSLPTIGFAAPAKQKTPTVQKAPVTQKGLLPQGKPFQYLNSRIDALDAKIELMIGRVYSLEQWRNNAEAVLVKLETDSVANKAAIAALEARIEVAEDILATKQDIIHGDCPANQSAVSVSQNPAVLVCRANVGTNGLAVSTVEVYENVAPATNEDVIAVCPAGTVPLGGSYVAGVDLLVASADIVDNGYGAKVSNASATNTSAITVTAKCLGIAP